jgi:MFS family permease
VEQAVRPAVQQIPPRRLMLNHFPAAGRVAWGLKTNLLQFLLLLLITGFIGGMFGSERTLLADIAMHDFGIASKTLALSFIVTFGVVKALANAAAGGLADRLGRRRVLILGWLVGLPMPLLVMLAPNWWWIVVANALLGLNQGLAWSVTIAMKMDLVHRNERGTAVGINEFTGYGSIALTTLFAGHLAALYGTRPIPFLVPTTLAAAGLLISLLLVRDTRDHSRHETWSGKQPPHHRLSYRQIFSLTTWQHPSLRSAGQAGLVTKMNDALIWGLMPLLLSAYGLQTPQIAIVGAIYPATWGLFQLATGTISDRVGRKQLIGLGMAVQALGVGLFLPWSGFRSWALAAAVLGVGTAMAYPTLLAVVGDVAEPRWRASSVGVYRLWRDSGFAWGALLTGLLADVLGFGWAFGVMALVALGSSLYVAIYMDETLPRKEWSMGTIEV